MSKVTKFKPDIIYHRVFYNMPGSSENHHETFETREEANIRKQELIESVNDSRFYATVLRVMYKS